MNYRIADIQGIGPAFTEKLKEAGIHDVIDLLKHAKNRTSIRALAESTGVSEKLVEKWTSMAALMQVNGIGPQYAELLLHSGVDTIEKLGEQQVAELMRTMVTVNAERNLTNALPGVHDVEQWITDVRNRGASQPTPMH